MELTKEVQSLMGDKRQEHPVELAKVAADAASRALKQNREEVVRLLQSNNEAQQKVFEGRWRSEAMVAEAFFQVLLKGMVFF